MAYEPQVGCSWRQHSDQRIDLSELPGKTYTVKLGEMDASVAKELPSTQLCGLDSRAASERQAQQPGAHHNPLSWEAAAAFQGADEQNQWALGSSQYPTSSEEDIPC